MIPGSNIFYRVALAGLCFLAAPACKSVSEGNVIEVQRIKFDASEDVLIEKIFPFFDLLNDHPGLAKKMSGNAEIASVVAGITARYTNALDTCKSALCLADACVISAAETEKLTAAFEKGGAAPLLKTGNIKDRKMQPYYTRDQSIKQLIERDILALNHIMVTYLGGKPSRYANIDGPAFPSGDSSYLRQVKQALRTNLSKYKVVKDVLGLQVSTALHILKLNHRDEAARYEPLTGKINEDAFKAVPKTDWKKFQASAMLVPGLGPRDPGVALDPGAARRCQLAANRFKKGEAPFIIVSGGHVYPAHTPFNEAIEMRKYLIEEMKIPASAVIVEPHARHTITNIRNAARLIYLFGMPADKPVKIVSDDLQSAYIFMLKGRFMTELGYLPYKGLNRDDSGAPLFYPDLTCFKRNPFDPLDP